MFAFASTTITTLGWHVPVRTFRYDADVSGDHHTDQGWTSLFYGNGAANLFIGDGGADTMYGRAGNDVLHGQGGVDLLYGEEGNDRLYGGTGADGLAGGIGNDDLFGGDGDDDLYGGGGDDRFWGGAGADFIWGDQGVDEIVYSASASGVAIDMTAGTGSGGDAEGDVFAGIENAQGSQHADVIAGDGQANRLAGLDGSDVISGGGGNDLIFGGHNGALAGDDLRGDAGDDHFLFYSGESGAGATIDTVRDFDDQGDDRLVFNVADPAEVAWSAVMLVTPDTLGTLVTIQDTAGPAPVTLYEVFLENEMPATVQADDFTFI